MYKFIIHFFKKEERTIDYEKIISFLEAYPEIKHVVNETTDSEFKFLYRQPILKSEAFFVFSKKSTVFDIHRLNPLYLDVNFRFEMPITAAYYNAEIVLKIVQELTKEFNFYVYNSLLSDVSEFNFKKVFEIFKHAKEQYKEKYSYQLKDVYFYPDSKFSSCLKYIKEQYDLQLYYREQNVYVPNYYIVADETDNVHFTIQWQEGKKTMFPPNIDYVYYIRENKTLLIPYIELMAKLEKYTINVPGFIENTKVIDEKKIKKVTKLLKKAKFTVVNKKFKKIEIEQIIDF